MAKSCEIRNAKEKIVRTSRFIVFLVKLSFLFCFLPSRDNFK